MRLKVRISGRLSESMPVIASSIVYIPVFFALSAYSISRIFGMFLVFPVIYSKIHDQYMGWVQHWRDASPLVWF